MAHTYGKSSFRFSVATNPVTTSTFEVGIDETILVLMLKVRGASDRTGGAPTFAGQTMTQASTTQKAAASPEASAEIWYLLNPPVGSSFASIPNSGSLTIFPTLTTGKSNTGYSAFDSASGSNGTSTNPAATSSSYSAGSISFAIVASGATTWAPSARTGTQIADTDDGADGGGEQYRLNAGSGSTAMGWTFGTSDDWGVVQAHFKEATKPVQFNNYLHVRGAEGISVTEKIR